MRLLCIGDIVGRSGREVVQALVPKLRAEQALDLVVINAENAAAGFGLTPAIAQDLFAAGADVLTLGNHAWDQREMLNYISNEPRIVRALNFRKNTPGQGASVITTKKGKKVLVAQVMLRLFMNASECPFAALDSLLTHYKLGGAALDAVVIDMHGEATSEKQAMGYFLDGRASVVFGTHTHVPTADARILPQGTAYQSDLGMAGDYQSVIGFDYKIPLARLSKDLPTGKLTPALGAGTLSGLYVNIDDDTGLALGLAPLRLGGVLQEVNRPPW